MQWPLMVSQDIWRLLTNQIHGNGGIASLIHLFRPAIPFRLIWEIPHDLVKRRTVNQELHRVGVRRDRVVRGWSTYSR